MKRSVYKGRLKAELKDRLKKAMIDGVPVADTEKFAASPDNFDRGSRWRILEPLIAALEPKYEDPSLVDPTTSKNLENNYQLKRM